MAAGDPEPRTYARLLEDCRLGTNRTKGGAGMLAGLIALCFGDLSANLVEHSPGALNAAFVSAIVVAGYFLVRSYIGYSNVEAILMMNTGLHSQRMLDEGEAKQRHEEQYKVPAVGAVLEYHHARLAFGIAIGAVMVSVAGYLVSVWWSAV